MTPPKWANPPPKSKPPRARGSQNGHRGQQAHLDTRGSPSCFSMRASTHSAGIDNFGFRDRTSPRKSVYVDLVDAPQCAGQQESELQLLRSLTGLQGRCLPTGTRWLLISELFVLTEGGRVRDVFLHGCKLPSRAASKRARAFTPFGFYIHVP